MATTTCDTTTTPFTFDQYVDRVLSDGQTTNKKDDIKLQYHQSHALLIQNVFEVISQYSSPSSSTLQTMTLSDIQSLFTYIYPKPSPDSPIGSCAKKIPNDTPFNLATQVFGVAPNDFYNESFMKNNCPHSVRLKQLNDLISSLQREGVIACEWFGVYRVIDQPNFLNYHPTDGFSVLVKEAYIGDYSRPDFPLNEPFAKHSSNSTVAMSGKVRVIHDVYGITTTPQVEEKKDHDEPYYVCDTRVESELCIPVWSRDGSRVIGIVDAEAWKTHFFSSSQTLFQFLYICYLLGQYHLFLLVS